MNWRPTRRTILRAIGVSAALSPLIPLPRDPVQSQSQPYPRRLVILFSPNGTIAEHFLPTGTELDFQFGSILQPLQAHQSYTTVIDGIRYPIDGTGNPHMQGPQRFLAGSTLLEGTEFSGGGGIESGWGSHASVDQVIAQSIGDQTPYPSLHLGVACGEPNVRSRMCYAGPAQPVAQQDDPSIVFERLFSQLAGDEAAWATVKTGRRSVMDLVKGQLDVLRASHGRDDRLKLDAHLEGIRAIERRLNTTSASGSECTSPAAPGTGDPVADASVPRVSREQIDLLVAALKCDLTRVATLMWGKASSELTFPALNIHQKHHDISHALDTDVQAQEDLRVIHRFHAGEVAYLLDRMAEIPEGDGSLLDHTAILWGNEVAVGNSHIQQPVPSVLLGGSDGYFKRGHYMQYGDVQQSRLLVSLCHYMGLDAIDTFGNLDTGSGPLPGLAT